MIRDGKVAGIDRSGCTTVSLQLACSSPEQTGIATIWVTLQASQAHHRLRQVTNAILVVTAIAAT